MNIDKILPLLKNVEDTVSKVRDLLYCPLGIRILILHREDISYVEMWDGDVITPRIVLLAEEKIEMDMMKQYIFDAISLIPLEAYEAKPIEIYSDVIFEDLPFGVQAVCDAFEIKREGVKEELINQLRERHDFNNYLSEIRSAQKKSNSST